MSGQAVAEIMQSLVKGSAKALVVRAGPDAVVDTNRMGARAEAVPLQVAVAIVQPVAVSLAVAALEEHDLEGRLEQIHQSLNRL